MIGQEFDAEQLYNSVVHYYIDKRGYSKEQANAIAQAVVRRETERRICANKDCRHSVDAHMNAGTCLVLNCTCRQFEKPHG